MGLGFPGRANIPAERRRLDRVAPLDAASEQGSTEFGGDADTAAQPGIGAARAEPDDVPASDDKQQRRSLRRSDDRSPRRSDSRCDGSQQLPRRVCLCTATSLLAPSRRPAKEGCSCFRPQPIVADPGAGRSDSTASMRPREAAQTLAREAKHHPRALAEQSPSGFVGSTGAPPLRGEWSAGAGGGLRQETWPPTSGGAMRLWACWTSQSTATGPGSTASPAHCPGAMLEQRLAGLLAA
jgi:hypothetical protein